MNANAPKIGLVSLGCPKALVDTERIVTRLRAEGYEVAPDFAGADAVLVNTCGFLDSAKEESLGAIAEAMAENGRVIVTGCLGGEADLIRERIPGVLAITGPHQYEAVMDAVHDHLPPVANPHEALVPPEGIHLTPRHYAYVKISEGCNNSCTFCIIPSIRGKLKSRPAADVIREAERLVRAGVRELLIVSQDTSAYGLDVRYAESDLRGRAVRTQIQDLAEALGDLGVWVRLQYIYPYPHVDDLIPLMAAGRILPYLDIPFQHAHPDVLRAMKRPANQEKVLARIKKWRAICPDLTIRSTFIVGFPGETEEQFQYLLDWLEEAELDRVGCFRYEPVAGATANDIATHVPADVIEERWHRLMAAQQKISERRLARKVGRVIEVLVDEVDEEGAIARSAADAPEVDGCVFLNGVEGLAPGDMLKVRVTHADEYDLWAEPVRDDD
jgi:ribosomal protein S12 methylthiotransferase